MNFSILARVVEELSRLLTEARVDRVVPADANDIVLCLRNRGKKMILLVSPDRSLPRLHLLSAKPASAQAQHPFLLFVKSRVTGGRIADISLVNDDRIVDMRFTRQGAEHHLFFELMGRAANLIITDGAGTILAVLYPVALSDGVRRPLLPGIRYALPEKKNQEFPAVPAASAEGSDESVSPNKEAELYYDRVLRNRTIEAARASLRSLIKKAGVKTERRREALCADFDAVSHAEEYRQAGDLILANLKNIRQGTWEAELTGYDGATKVIALDPKYSGAGNAEQYFKKYRKARAGRDIVAGRLAAATEESDFLRTLLAELEKAVDESDVARIRSRLSEKGILRHDRKKAAEKIARNEPAPFRTVRFGSWEILIGKSAAGNDYLTTKLASPDDLWLHAEGLPGSHVVVKNPERKPVPPEVLEKAASLAAFYSKGRGASKVSITYTRARNVRKPKGAKPGLVMLTERSAIMAVPREQ